jgi:NADPH:quinone reductase
MHAAAGRVAPDAPVPRTLGTEGAGTVDGRPVLARGHGIGTARDGLWATAAVVPHAALIDVPDGVALEQAAAMGVAGVTAWRTVTELAQVAADDTVLVLGASGGVGAIIVSAAHALGATVLARPAKRGTATGSCAAAPTRSWSPTPPRSPAIADRDPTVVIDPLGGGFHRGRHRGAPAARPPAPVRDGSGTRRACATAVAVPQGITVYGYAGLLESDETMRARIEDALQVLATGQLSVPVDSVVPLKQVNDAFERISQRDVLGKVVLDTQP